VERTPLVVPQDNLLVGYANGSRFPEITRVFSLVLAGTALVLAIIFVIALPWNGLSLGDGLTFVGILLAAASFFASAGSPGAAGWRATTRAEHERDFPVE